MAKKANAERPGDQAPKACNILPDTVLGNDVALVAENMERILSSPSYSLAQEDAALLQRVEMRGVRMLLELGKPELALLADNIQSTVIVFGGTQIVERPAAERRLSGARGCSSSAATTTTPGSSPASCRSTTSAKTSATTWSSPAAGRASWRPPIAAPSTSAASRSA
jgi:hypothetical protein